MKNTQPSTIVLLAVLMIGIKLGCLAALYNTHLPEHEHTHHESPIEQSSSYSSETARKHG